MTDDELDESYRSIAKVTQSCAEASGELISADLSQIVANCQIISLISQQNSILLGIYNELAHARHRQWSKSTQPVADAVLKSDEPKEPIRLSKLQQQKREQRPT